MHGDEIHVRTIDMSAMIKKVQTMLLTVRRASCQVFFVDGWLVKFRRLLLPSREVKVLERRTHICWGANTVTSGHILARNVL